MSGLLTTAPMIYLDNNATTFLHPEVAAAMDECQRQGLANPSSAHAAGRRARRILEEAKLDIARLLGAKTTGMDADRVILTSGGTEANNLAIRGLAGTPPARIVVSAIEHPSVLAVAERLQRAGHELALLPVDEQGVIRLDQLPNVITGDTGLVSVMLGNNETGTLQPVAEVVARTRRLITETSESSARVGNGTPVRFHTDAVQGAGKIPIDFRALGVDALTISGHKFHGPVGIGVLLLRQGVDLEPMLAGGFQQAGLRPGTEPVALAVGLHQALRVWEREQVERQARMAALRDQFEAELRQGYPGVIVNGGGSKRLPHTTNVAFPGVDRQALVMALDLAGIACSTGSACASGSSEPSPVLRAMGLAEEIVGSSLRVSLSALTTTAEVLQAAQRISSLAKDLGRQGNSA